LFDHGGRPKEKKATAHPWRLLEGDLKSPRKKGSSKGNGFAQDHRPNWRQQKFKGVRKKKKRKKRIKKKRKSRDQAERPEPGEEGCWVTKVSL